MAENMIGDSGKLCRLCLSEAEVMCPIFASKNGPQGVALPQRIMSCAQIKVTNVYLAIHCICILIYK